MVLVFNASFEKSSNMTVPLKAFRSFRPQVISPQLLSPPSNVPFYSKTAHPYPRAYPREMMSGLVSTSLSLPEWQAVKMIFFAPWVLLHTVENLTQNEACPVGHLTFVSKLQSAAQAKAFSNFFLHLHFKGHCFYTHCFVGIFENL